MKKCILVLSCILGASLFAVSFAGYGEGKLSAAESDVQEQEMSKEEVEEMLGDGTDSDETADTDKRMRQRIQRKPTTTPRQ